MNADIYVKIEGETEAHFIHFPDINHTIRIEVGALVDESKLPEGAEKSLWDSTVSSKLDNVQSYNSGLDPLYLVKLVAELKSRLFE